MKKFISYILVISIFHTLIGCVNKQIKVDKDEQHIIVYRDKKTVTRYYTIENISYYTNSSNVEIESKNDDEILLLLNNSKYSNFITYNNLEKDNDGYKVNYDSYMIGHSCNEEIIEYIYETIGEETECSRNMYERRFKRNQYLLKFYNNDNIENFKYENYIGNYIYRATYVDISKTFITLPNKILFVGVYPTDVKLKNTIKIVNENTLEINGSSAYAEVIIIFED